MNGNGSNPWQLQLFGSSGTGFGVTNPAITGWFESWFPTPRQPEPMKKGEPQEPASRWPAGGSTAGAIAGRVGEITGGVGESVNRGIEGAIQNTLGKVFAPERMRDATVYLGAALLLVIAVWSALR